jgi:superfamily II DNA or RNA helicase
LTCKRCSTDENLYGGWAGRCLNCGKLRWSPDGDKLNPIPGFVNSSPPIIEAEDITQSILNFLNKSKLTRMPSLRRYKGEGKTESLEILTNIPAESLSKITKINDRYEKYKSFFVKFGLDLVPLIPENKIIHDDPLLICKKGEDAYFFSEEIRKSTETQIPPISIQDPSIDSYLTHINFHAQTIFSQDFRVEQEKAIKQILTYTGSKQVISLPTGYGKTRIVQTVTNILRDHDKGPTLMISPIIALRDDQREAFLNDLKMSSRTFNSSFLTPEIEDYDNIIQDLLDDRLDLFCCAPEHLMQPDFQMSWIEVFSRMKNPISTLVVDEAHLIGDWGATIRPDFLLLGELKNRLLELNPELRVILQSATITTNERKELSKLFDELYELEDIEVKETRPDLFFRIDLETPKSFDSGKKTIDYEKNVSLISEIYEDMPGKWVSPFEDSNDKGRAPLLIYSATKGHAKNRIVPSLKSNGFNKVKTYTADTTTKNSRRLEYKENKIDAMVATSAFGMGIDKPDIWMIYYMGLPFTLKALYQGFGRAARGSNWDQKNTNPVRGGVCIATIPDSKLRPFNPELRLSLAAERIWSLFNLKKTVILSDEGYIITPSLDKLDSSLWHQPKLEISNYLEDIEADLDLDNWNFEQGEQRFKRAITKQKFSNLSFRMWSLSCLQRNNTISIMGFYPQILCENTSTGEEWTLEDAIKKGGYEEVLRILKSIDHKNFITTPSNQERMILIKINKNIFDWNDLIRYLKEGHKSLEERHKMGNKELKKFIKMVKERKCLRLGFSPAIGRAIDKTKDCRQLINQNKNNSKLSVIPCYFCAKTHFPSLLDDKGVIWASDNINVRIENNFTHTNPKLITNGWHNVPDPNQIYRIPKNDIGEINEIIIPNPENVDLVFYDHNGDRMENFRISKSVGTVKLLDDIPLNTEAICLFGTNSENIRFLPFDWRDLLDEWSDLIVNNQ